MQTRPTSTRRPPTTIPRERSVHDTELVDEMTDFLDEVDAILEDQEWMMQFRQRGGQ